jgi:hypothetical protein
MRPTDVIEDLSRHRVLIEREGDELVLHAPFGDCLPEALMRTLREHKAELLAHLAWEERADVLLLESTRRLAAAWPAACPLNGAKWERFEEALHEAYWSLDLDRLSAVLASREAYAYEQFADYRKERRP